jgi:ABC-type transport system involved in Fe-S cluster assembly fused permease/ATPase subunit
LTAIADDQEIAIISTKATPHTVRRRRHLLGTVSGLLTEASRVYRAMRSGKLDHEKGRSLVWVLAQMRAMVEAQHLGRIEVKLNELQATAESRGLIVHDHDGADQPARLPH